MKWLIPKPTEVLLDIDSLADADFLKGAVAADYLRIAGVRALNLKVWPSQNHYHAVIELNEALPMLARLAISAALGSDPRYPLCGIFRYMNGNPEPMMLRES